MYNYYNNKGALWAIPLIIVGFFISPIVEDMFGLSLEDIKAIIFFVAVLMIAIFVVRMDMTAALGFKDYPKAPRYALTMKVVLFSLLVIALLSGMYRQVFYQ